MPRPGDSRPFVVLRQSTEDFQAGFDTDIKSCLKLLESKIASLLCDPDTLNTPSKDGRRLSADFQFTKAKYEVFVQMKDLFDQLESSWNEQLAEMKSSFLEEVEIFLAKTKLETHENENKTSTSAKNRNRSIESTSTSSLLSPLIEKAKRIPGFSSVFQDSEANEDSDEVEENGYSSSCIAPRQVIRPTQKSSPLSNKLSVNKYPQKIAQVENILEEEMDYVEEDEEEIIPVEKASPVKTRGRKPKQSAPQKSTPVKKAPVVLTPLRNSAVKRGRKSILKADSVLESELHTTPSRSTRKRTAGKDSIPITPPEVIEAEDSDTEAAPKTPKNVHFSVGFDINDDLEIYSPEVNISKSAPRRKTIVYDSVNSFSDINLTPNIGRSKAKRKTIGGSAAVGPSPKRLKQQNNFNSTLIVEENESDLSGGESTAADNYSPWVLLDDLDGKVPTQPGIYELKVYKAKKSAYIGSCDNLRQKLTLHKIGQNSGHKHLDKFLERNKKDVQVRYEKIISAPQAKNEAMKRIESFVELHRTTPAYN